jgi:prepilin-type N-terminal cleavage/methylation domain-containing protein
MRMIHRGEKGLTLIELLIVIAILGIIAAVIIPNIAGFITSGNIAAANTEVENVKTGALGYFAKYNQWPVDSNNLTGVFVSGVPKAYYTFDTSYGWVITGSALNVTGWQGIVFTGAVNGTNGMSGHWIAA